MLLRKKILILSSVSFVCLLIGIAGLYFYSMGKVKNGLTYFHSRIVQGQGYVESLEVSHENLGIKFPFGVEATNLQLDIVTTGTDQEVLINTGWLNCQLQGVPAGTLKVLARDINMTSGVEDKPLLSNQYRIRNIELRFAEYESYI